MALLMQPRRSQPFNVTHHEIADHEIERAKNEYIADVIAIEDLEYRIEGWLKWEKLPTRAARREFEEKWRMGPPAPRTPLMRMTR